MIRANAARYPISARCGIPGVPRSTCYWMTGHPGTERADPIAGDVRAVRRDGRERHGARKFKAALERKQYIAEHIKAYYIKGKPPKLCDLQAKSTKLKEKYNALVPEHNAFQIGRAHV